MGSARASRANASPARTFGALAETKFDFRLDRIVQFPGQRAVVEQFPPAQDAFVRQWLRPNTGMRR